MKKFLLQVRHASLIFVFEIYEDGHNKTGIATLIAKKSIAKNTGVRGLRVRLENVLVDSMFENSGHSQETLNDVVLGVT
nr:Clp protease regulatory subunit CLPX2, mitochondrial-like [Tanacetum cinerariifolium]